MSEIPSLPPTPRRRALARRAGMLPLSRPLVAAAAWAGAAGALAWAGAWLTGGLRAIAARDVAAAAAVPDPIAALTGSGAAAVRAAVSLALPVVLAIAAAAALAHVAQTRTLWLPRRRLRGAPTPRASASRRIADAGLALTAGAAAIAVVGRLLWLHGGDLVRAGASPRALPLLAVAALQIAMALVVVAVGDWLLRVQRHAADLRMTSRERRDDDRAAGADPRWRRARRDRAVEGSAAEVATCALVLIDDRVAVAVRWDPRWHPVPRVAVRGSDRAARSLVAAARRRAVPVQHDPALAADLAALAPGAAVPSALHGRLARHLAAIAR